MVRFLVFGCAQWPHAVREMSGRRNKVAADYYRTAAASRWADYCLAASTGMHGGGKDEEERINREIPLTGWAPRQPRCWHQHFLSGLIRTVTVLTLKC